MRTVRLLLGIAALLAGLLVTGGRAGTRPAPSAPGAGGGAGTGADPSDPGDTHGRDTTSQGAEGADRPEGRSAAEWTTLAASALVVALLVGAALYEHFVRDEPAGVRIAVEVALDQAEARDGVTYIPFTVVNTGRAPAENVVVLFEITLGGETVEESTADIAFLPTSGSVEGELVTALDPATHTVEARVATVQTP